MVGEFASLGRADGAAGRTLRSTVAIVHRRTKIIATLGPASQSEEAVSRLVAAGMDVARLNFSHGTHDTHARFVEWVRAAADEHERAIAVLQDVQGPRIRVGTFPGGSVKVAQGDEIVLRDGDGVGDRASVYVQHLAAAQLVAGDQVLVSDGLITLEIIDRADGAYRAVVVEGGELADNKGAAFPGATLGLPAITAKDRIDLAFGRELGVDIVAASFVESGEDIRVVREIVGDTPIIAKIERVAAYANLDSILAEADGAMVARGDLGVELGFEPLPRAQKEILARTNRAGGISITATEMLESMVRTARPSRAEVSDVANAVLDGTDAVMLSAETAVGKYPVRSVEVMAAICLEAESGAGFMAGEVVAFVDGSEPIASAIAQATAEAANSLGLEIVVAFTESGSTAGLVAKYRPQASIVAFTPNEVTYRRMALLWGVIPMMFPRLVSTDEMILQCERVLLDHRMAAPGDWVAMAAGIPPNRQSSTNLLKLHVVGGGSAGVPAG